ncbi:cytochrome ubiquinol oxidase subunit I [Exiguobacterium flavidum]|uniref:cytochrome ubiquinol oxidase subunit I n=1 Tax=Exiguobacterium flavidum TaxID=2184695 RepID=UPI000DF7458E|nr:cytochrome ubiquinol oxidase subunit I [Exiguobacterium flavidum]
MFNDPVMLSRILTGLTLGFHIIFATVGVGVPLMVLVAEYIGIKRNDQHYILMARRWTRGYIVTVAVGVVTGTAIGLQLSLLWPSLMQVAGQTIALPLFMETFAFFFEAIFLGIYLYTWDRFKNPWLHWLIGIPVAIGATASAFFITTVNSFMNSPEGFKIVNGALTEIEPLKAMFNTATPTKVSHVIVSAYLTVAFILAAIAAFHLLRKKALSAAEVTYHKKGLRLTVIAGLIFAFSTALIGDFSGKYLAKYQPEKLAAAEWHFETTDEAELIFGGYLDEQADGSYEIKGALKVPYALSILAGGAPSTEVIGLNEFAKEDQAPLFVHYFFDLMVSIGMYLAAISALFVIAFRLKRLNPYNKWILRGIFIGGPLAVLSIEAGWMYAEIGRQPWTLYGIMRTADAATTSTHVGPMLILFSLLYLLLGTVSSVVLIRMFKNNPAGKELAEAHHTRGEAMFADDKK